MMQLTKDMPKKEYYVLQPLHEANSITVLEEKKAREDQGKKMTASDERYLREATEKLIEELGFVLELDKEETRKRLSAALMN